MREFEFDPNKAYAIYMLATTENRPWRIYNRRYHRRLNKQKPYPFTVTQDETDLVAKFKRFCTVTISITKGKRRRVL